MQYQTILMCDIFVSLSIVDDGSNFDEISALCK